MGDAAAHGSVASCLTCAMVPCPEQAASESDQREGGAYCCIEYNAKTEGTAMSHLGRMGGVTPRRGPA